MKKSTALFLHFFIFISFIFSQKTQTVIQDITVIPMDGNYVLENQTVILEDGKIKEITDQTPEKNDFQQYIDGKGKYLFPGLIDMHVHIQDKGDLKLALVNGVTTVRNLMGMPMHLKWKKEMERGAIPSPFIFTTSPQLTGKDDKDVARKKVKDATHAQKLVRKYHTKGYDFIKTYNRLQQDIYKSTLEQAASLNMPVVAHPSFKMPYLSIIESDVSSIEHTEDIVQQYLRFKLDSLKLDTVVEAYANSKVWHCPTLSVYEKVYQILNQGEAILKSENSKYMNPFIRSRAKKEVKAWQKILEKSPNMKEKVRKQHEFHIYIVRKLHEAGAKIICGSDSGILFNPSGFAVHEELDLYLQAGMTNYEALKTATYNPAQVYPEFEKFGVIKEGNYANLIICEKNPLEDISTLRNPSGVFINGRYLNQKKLIQYKGDAYDRSGGFNTKMKYLWFILFGK